MTAPSAWRGRGAAVRRVLAGAGLVACAASNAAPIPTFAEVRAAHRPSDITLQDRHGTPIQTLRIDPTVRRLPWVPLQELSPALVHAIVLSEDQRFWQHSGIDWQAVAKSAWANALNTRTRGASTLTMQLAGLLDDGLARPTQGRSVAQKLGQAYTATLLEQRWTKSDILEAYLNGVPLRGELVGINALAQTLFDKHPSGLDAQEAAITAALVRAPNAPPARVAERACAVLRLQHATCDGLQGLSEAALSRRGAMPLGEQLAPHFARQALRAADLPMQDRTAQSEPSQSTRNALQTRPASDRAVPAQSGGSTAALQTTLDAPLQRLALAALRQQLAELRGRNVEDGAVLVLDNATGEVLSWVGSSGGAYSDAPEVDGVLARRQPGSTLKPFVYELAFERGLITPATPLDDSPTQLATAAGLYLPQNYDRHFRGWVSARTALGASLNMPAVRVASLLPPGALHQRLNELGLALPEAAGYYGHALALGGADVTLLALTNAYRALANGGLLAAPRLLSTRVAGTAGAAAHAGMTAGSAGRRVATPAAVHLVTHILADNNARAATFGLHSALATHGFAAVKTGTSKDLRDNWCVGYTSRYTVGVWVGNASGAPMHGVSGISGAAPVWRAVVQHLHASHPSTAPALTPGVVVHQVSLVDAAEPAREELFLSGTGPAQRHAAAATGGVRGRGGVGAREGRQEAQRFGITSPRDGSVFALDPDIPITAQRVTFEGEAGTWWVDGRPVGQGTLVRWLPTPGSHRVALLDAAGRVVQQVRVEVRSLRLAAARAAPVALRAR